jgi:hypothetical protein
MVSTLILARSANSSWVSEAARRHCRSSGPKGGVSADAISYLHPLCGQALALPDGMKT